MEELNNSEPELSNGTVDAGVPDDVLVLNEKVDDRNEWAKQYIEYIDGCSAGIKTTKEAITSALEDTNKYAESVSNARAHVEEASKEDIKEAADKLNDLHAALAALHLKFVQDCESVKTDVDKRRTVVDDIAKKLSYTRTQQSISDFALDSSESVEYALGKLQQLSIPGRPTDIDATGETTVESDTKTEETTGSEHGELNTTGESDLNSPSKTLELTKFVFDDDWSNFFATPNAAWIKSTDVESIHNANEETSNSTGITEDVTSMTIQVSSDWTDGDIGEGNDDVVTFAAMLTTITAAITNVKELTKSSETGTSKLQNADNQLRTFATSYKDTSGLNNLCGQIQTTDGKIVSFSQSVGDRISEFSETVKQVVEGIDVIEAADVSGLTSDIARLKSEYESHLVEAKKTIAKVQGLQEKFLTPMANVAEKVREVKPILEAVI